MFNFIPAYLLYSAIFTVGLFGIVVLNNMIKKLIALSIMQSGILLFYISISYKNGLKPPIIKSAVEASEYVNPLPQVLMLTAIVVGLSVTAIGIALCIKISKLHKTYYRSEISEIKDL